MKKHQTGEVILATMVVMMIVMMAVVWSSRGQMGMHGAVQAEKSGSAEQQTKAEQPLPLAPKEPSEFQH